MFRTVTVYTGEKISLDGGWMVISGEKGEQRVPIEDIYSLVIDNRNTVLTVPVITRLTENGTHILVCDEKHLPSTVILPQSIHYRPLAVVRRQIGLPQDVKDALWDRVVIQKILNQADFLEL